MTGSTTIVTQIHDAGYGPSAWKVIADPAPVAVTATLNLAGGPQGGRAPRVMC